MNHRAADSRSIVQPSINWLVGCNKLTEWSLHLQILRELVSPPSTVSQLLQLLVKHEVQLFLLVLCWCVFLALLWRPDILSG